MELYERYHDKLPIVVIVTIGHYAEIDIETFGSEQIFRVAKVSRQPRVIARDKEGRYLTLPVNIAIKFRVVKGYKKVGEIQTLKEIVEENNTPIQVQFALDAKHHSFRIGSSDASIYTFGNIVITEVYEEKYFLVNALNSAVLYPTYMLIPVYLKEVSFARVTKVRDGTKQDWKNLLIGLDKAAENFKYDITDGNKEVALLPEECAVVTSDNIYDYIDPKSFVSVAKKSKIPDYGEYVDITVETQEEKSKTKKKASAKPPPLPGRNTTPRKTSTTSLTPPTFSPTTPPYVNQQKSMTSTETGSGGSIRSLTDEGDYVRGYSIREIGDSLEKLHLSKYTKQFRDAHIDGACLLELDAGNLKEDFSMKGFEAKKLMLFAHTGHIPS
ncbi:hypothetical protein SNE40_006089 [Patella caerulea]